MTFPQSVAGNGRKFQVHHGDTERTEEADPQITQIPQSSQVVGGRIRDEENPSHFGMENWVSSFKFAIDLVGCSLLERFGMKADLLAVVNGRRHQLADRIENYLELPTPSFTVGLVRR